MVSYKSSYKNIFPGGLAQLGERLPCKQEVTSSTLVFSTWQKQRSADAVTIKYSSLAQSVEHSAVNRKSIRLLTEVSLVQVQQGELTKPVNSTFTGFICFYNMPLGGKIDRLLKKQALDC